jgi:hypothetical protein
MQQQAPPPERRHVDNNLILQMMSQIDLKLDSVIAEGIDFRTSIGLLKDAFPDGDTKTHRLYHEEKIDELKAKKAFYQKLTFELTKWGLIIFAGWMAINTWKELLKGPN